MYFLWVLGVSFPISISLGFGTECEFSNIWCSFFCILFSNKMLCLFALHLFIIQDQKVMFYQSDKCFSCLMFFFSFSAWHWALGCAWVYKLILYAWGFLCQIRDFGKGASIYMAVKLQHWSECCKALPVREWLIKLLYYIYTYAIWTTDLCTRETQTEELVIIHFIIFSMIKDFKFRKGQNHTRITLSHMIQ